MVIIENNFVGVSIAFLIGLAISVVNYAISKYVLKYHTSKYPFLQLVRTPLQVGYLVVLYFCGDVTPWDTMWLLIGGALGVTVPMLFFTYRLVKLSDHLKAKEDETDG